ncbi:hypothetical protein [Labedaea rhizosphaerae]|nr:hypothetical protein [Labedaea rhizosphaerae]
MATENKWAPWWVYVVVIVGCNFAKQRLIEDRVPGAANVAITVVMVAVLVAAITAIHRARPGRGAGTRP